MRSVTATDVSPDALALARENAEQLGLAVELVETSLLDGVEGPFDLVVSNPPYVREAEVADAAAGGARLGAADRVVGDDDRADRRAPPATCCDGRRDRVRDARGRRRRRPRAARGARLRAGYDLAGSGGRERVVEGWWRPRR